LVRYVNETACYNPNPVRVAVCGLPAALVLTFKVALRLPVPEGVKVTLIVQLVPGANVLPHV
jgi:hypothetical protein